MEFVEILLCRLSRRMAVMSWLCLIATIDFTAGHTTDEHYVQSPPFYVRLRLMDMLARTAVTWQMCPMLTVAATDNLQFVQIS